MVGNDGRYGCGMVEKELWVSEANGYYHYPSAYIEPAMCPISLPNAQFV